MARYADSHEPQLCLAPLKIVVRNDTPEPDFVYTEPVSHRSFVLPESGRAPGVLDAGVNAAAVPGSCHARGAESIPRIDRRQFRENVARTPGRRPLYLPSPFDAVPVWKCLMTPKE
jgi:hypothetical protein